MKYFILIAFALLSFGSLHAQESNPAWKLYAEKDGVKIEYRQSDCHIDNSFHQSWYLIRLTNSNTSSVYVNYDMDLYYNEVCKTCGKNEYKYGQKLAANEVMEGICDFKTLPNLKIFIKFLDIKNKQTLTDFRLSNIKVTKL